MLISIFGSLFGLIIPVVLIAGVVYLVVRSKGDHHEGPTVYDALAAYFYAIIGASMITTAVGVILFIDVALKETGSGNGEQISLASVLLSTGLVVGLLHLGGKLLIQRRANRPFPGVRRVYLFCMLGIGSLAGLVSLPLAIHSVVRYYVVDHPYDDFPSTEVAVATVVVPLWVYYLYRVVRETSGKRNGEDSSVAAGTQSTAK